MIARNTIQSPGSYFCILKGERQDSCHMISPNESKIFSIIETMKINLLLENADTYFCLLVLTLHILPFIQDGELYSHGSS